MEAQTQKNKERIIASINGFWSLTSAKSIKKFMTDYDRKKQKNNNRSKSVKQLLNLFALKGQVTPISCHLLNHKLGSSYYWFNR